VFNNDVEIDAVLAAGKECFAIISANNTHTSDYK